MKLRPKHWEKVNDTLKNMYKIFSKLCLKNNFILDKDVRSLIKQDILKESQFFIKNIYRKSEESDESTDSDSEKGDSDYSDE